MPQVVTIRPTAHTVTGTGTSSNPTQGYNNNMADAGIITVSITGIAGQTETYTIHTFPADSYSPGYTAKKLYVKRYMGLTILDVGGGASGYARIQRSINGGGVFTTWEEITVDSTVAVGTISFTLGLGQVISDVQVKAACSVTGNDVGDELAASVEIYEVWVEVEYPDHFAMGFENV